MSKLCPLFSGSSGNSFYIDSRDQAILIDAGRSAKQIEKAILENSLDIKKIKAIFVTHEHSDHIKGLRVLASRYKIKIYASIGTLDKLGDMGVLEGNLTYENIDNKGVTVGDIKVSSFMTSHDSAQSIGLIIETPYNKKIAFATDLGVVSEDILKVMSGCDAVIIESNHDEGMLKNGPYPYYLKQRILSEKGHLSNESCSKVLPKLLKSGATRFMLAHLSRENNIDILALQTSLCSLEGFGAKRGLDFLIDVLPEYSLGEHTMII